MINKKGLDWNKISWDVFQDLCIHFTQYELPELRFENYLKQGNDQKGIDLHSLKPNGGKYTFIQCKCEKKLFPGDLTNIVNQFTYNSLVDECSDFILITTADLQNSKSKKRQSELVKKLKNDFNIDLQFWDKNYLDTQLQKYYTVVEKYFGKLDADELCHSKNISYRPISEPKDYIDRQIERYNQPLLSIWDNDFTAIELEKLFVENRFSAKRMAILGEAHSGKSIEMQKVLHNLSASPLSYYPILIDLKELNVSEIDRCLQVNYPNWKTIPAKDIIIGLDGLDEVPTEKFLSQVKYIKAFAMENPNISLIICCRRLFFDHYEIENELRDFEIFELRPLNEHSIHKYLVQQLGSDIDHFYKKIYNAGIYDFLFSPFYLIQLVKSYKENSNQIPENKISLLDSFIDTTLQNTRRNIDGKLLKRQSVKYNNSIQKLAFALQLAGTNSFIDETIQLLFDDKEILLLQNSSIVNFKNNYWSFTNALYQEHLAAQYLINLPFKDIINLSTNGTQIKKIKTKWLQTITSLFSLIDEKGSLYKPLIEFIKQDNIEIIFKTEGTKFSSDQMITFLDLLVEKLNIYNNRLQLINDRVIASFINSQPKAKDHCIELIKQELPTPIKTVFTRVLRNVELSETQKENLKKMIFSEVFNTLDDFYANQLLELSAEFNLATKDFVYKLTQSSLNSKHEFRDGVYQNILKLKLIDEFYDYALEGIPVLIRHNQEIDHNGSYYFLEMLLASVKNTVNAKKLLISLNQTGHFEFFERSINKGLFLTTLNENLVKIYKSDITIIYPLLNLIKKIGREFTKSDYEELSNFFNETNSNSLALKILFPDIKRLDFWNFAYLLTEDCFDFIFNEYEEGNISLDKLWSIYVATDHYGNKDIANKFFSACKATTESHFLPKWNPIHDEYEKYSRLIDQNDLSYILNKGSFKKGIIKYFKAFGSDIISKNELYIDYNASPTKIKANSLIIYHFLKDRQPWDSIEKKLALQQLEKMDFEWFQVLKILGKYSTDFIQSNIPLYEIVKEYYYKKLPICIFESTYSIEISENGEIEHWHKTLEVKIAKIFSKFEFDTPEEILIKMICADNGGIKNFEHHSLNNTYSLSETILEKISNKNIELLKQSILDNIKLGISDMGVLENHIGLCRHLKIYDSKDIIYDILTKLFFENKYTSTSYSINDILEVYIELGGTVSDLIPLIKYIKNYNAYCFIYMAKKIGDSFSAEIAPILKIALYRDDTKEERKFEIAHTLINIGEIEGLTFLVSYLEIHKRISNRNLGEISFKKLDTRQILAQIDGICYFIVDDAQKVIHWTESGQGIVRNWILSLAEKSEEDLILVNDFLIEKSNHLSSKYKRYRDIHWYRLLALEKFRDFDSNYLDINQISKLVN